MSYNLKSALSAVAAFVVPSARIPHGYVVLDTDTLQTRLVPVGCDYDDCEVIGFIADNGQLKPNTKADLPDAAWRKASAMYQQMFKQLPKAVIADIGMTEAIDLQKMAAAEHKAQQDAKKADAIALTAEQAAAIDQKREESRLRREVQIAQETAAIKQRILERNSSIEPQFPNPNADPVFIMQVSSDADLASQLLSALSSAEDPNAFVSKLTKDQLKTVAAAKQLSISGSRDALLERILTAKSEQNGSFATV